MPLHGDDLDRTSDGISRDSANLPLFRSESIAAKDEYSWGEPVASLPIGWSLIGLFLCLLVAVTAIFLLTSSFSRKETVRGVLKPIGGEVRINAPQGGVIKEIYVVEGGHVERGQVLALVSTSRVAEGGQTVDEEILAALQQEEASLRLRLAAVDVTAPLAATASQSEVSALLAERDAALAAIESNRARRKLALERVDAARILQEKGLLALEELRKREEALITVDQAIVDARAREASLSAQIDRARALSARVTPDTAVNRSQVQEALSFIAEKRAQALASRGYEIRAPVSGEISALQAAVGQTVEAVRPLMTLTPEHSRLKAELFVPSRAIGFVTRGDNVRLLYDAFPYQRFGPGTGVVEAVSATVLLPQEVEASLDLREPVYRVVVQLDRQDIQAFGKSTPLQPGMALTADIVLESRPFAMWLLEPLLAARGRM